MESRQEKQKELKELKEKKEVARGCWMAWASEQMQATAWRGFWLMRPLPHTAQQFIFESAYTLPFINLIIEKRKSNNDTTTGILAVIA